MSSTTSKSSEVDKCWRFDRDTNLLHSERLQLARGKVCMRFQQSDRVASNRSHRQLAFTIVELMVSIAVIFVLITAAFVAFKAVKSSANRTQSINALRQMMTGYNMYTGEHKQRLMPGFVDPTLLGTAATELDIKAKYSDGTFLDKPSTGPYVWRLAPYLDYSWQTFMTDYRNSDTVELMGLKNSAGKYGPSAWPPPGNEMPPNPNSGSPSDPPEQFRAGLFPSFGLNSIFVGGDSYHGGAAVSARSPWDISSGSVQPRPTKLAAVRVGEVKSPSKLVVFAPTGLRPNTGSAQLNAYPSMGQVGYFELRAPFAGFDDATGTWVIPQWIMSTAAGDLDFIGNGPAGVPIDRLGQGKIPVGNLDGSTSTEELGRLAVDMSRWSPFAIKVN